MQLPSPLTIEGVQKDIGKCIHSSLSEGITEYQKRAIEALVQDGIYLLASGIPIVRCFFSSEERFFVQCIAENSADFLRGSSDLISPWLPQEISLSIFSLQRTIFSIEPLQNRSFVFISIEATVEGPEAIRILKERSFLLQQQISLTLKLPSICQQMIAAQTSSHIYSKIFRQELLRWLSRRPPHDPGLILSEIQRVLLTTDIEFKGIRTPSHFLKLIRSHLHLKAKHSKQSPSHANEKQLFYRLFRSKLHFPFGTKDVICLVISLKSLSLYERFDERHILLACQRCLPSLEAVPRSFYVYPYPADTAISLYIELEKKDGSMPTLAERKTLREELRTELLSSIEQVASRIDIPQNEEDLLRNLLLLSQQIKSPKDPPQVIVQFHGQTDSSLDFHVTLVRSIWEGDADIPRPAAADPYIARSILLRCSEIDRFRQNYVKQGLMFLVECPKESFLRRDRSIDFLKARESVVHGIESVYGKVQDLNGGLIYQHHQLLSSISPLLTKEEHKDVSLIEDLFQSMSPARMKEFLGPEHMVTVFRQLAALRADARQKLAQPFIVEEYAKEIFFGFVCSETLEHESLFQATSQFHLKENEFAVCQAVAEGRKFCFVICLSQDLQTRRQLAGWLQQKVNKKASVRSSRPFRISLPRSSIVLDPRIGADRISGAVIKMVYEGLMRLDCSGNPTLALASEVHLSDDGKKYTFKLRPSSWTNGQPVTAHDFEYSWKKILDPAFRTFYDFFFFSIRNARQVKEGKLPLDTLGLRAVDDQTLVIELDRPCPHFLELTTLWIFSPLCKNLDLTNPGWAYYADKNFLCNGPFKLKRMSRAGSIYLEKNPHYWDKESVSLEKIEITTISDPAKALQLFYNKELDWVGDPLAEVSLRRADPKGHKVYSQPLSAVQSYQLNVHHPLFRSKKVRHAFSLAIDRQKLISQHLYGDEKPAHSILTSELSLLPSECILEFNLEEAQKLFSDGLQEEGLSSSLLKPLKMVVYDQEPYKTTAMAISRAWEEAFGISIIVELRPWNTFLNTLPSSSHDILGLVWYSWYSDPLYTLKIFSNQKSHFNASQWTCPEIQELLDTAEKEKDRPLRNTYLREAEQWLMDEMPAIPVYECNCRYMKAEDIDGIYVSQIGNVEFKWAAFQP
jgi:oligopeptide transport system substrate-binding protein